MGYPKIAGMSIAGGTSAKKKSKPSMVKNEAGGFGFKANDWHLFKRWLILGSEKPTFYATERKLTKDNSMVALRCLGKDPKKYIDTIVEVRQKGLAPKNDTSLFALALVYKFGTNEAKAYAASAVNAIARTGDNIQELSTMLTGTRTSGVRSDYMRGWGRSLRTGVAGWFLNRDVKSLVYQAIKYRSRHKTSLSDLVRMSHPNPGLETVRSQIFRWMVNGTLPEVTAANDVEKAALDQLFAYEKAKLTVDKDGKIDNGQRELLANLITDYRLPWEAVPNQWLNDPYILHALIVDMPIGATVRQLPRLTWSGAIESREVLNIVLDRLNDPNIIKAQNIHPVKLMQAAINYDRGQSAPRAAFYGRGTAQHYAHGKTITVWAPVRAITSALNNAFYMSFGNVNPTGLNRFIAVDVSGSMWGADHGWADCSGLGGVAPRYGAAMLAMITMRTEPSYIVTGFAGDVESIPLRPEMRLDQVITAMEHVRAGYTRIGAAVEFATKNKIPVDMFEIYTDNQVNAGPHPVTALQKYQDVMGRKAKMAFVAMVGYNASVADPSRNDMMDFIGFDPTVPDMLGRFASGELL